MVEFCFYYHSETVIVYCKIKEISVLVLLGTEILTYRKQIMVEDGRS